MCAQQIKIQFYFAYILHKFVIMFAQHEILASFEYHWESNIAEGSDEMNIAQNAKVANEKRCSCLK